MRKDEEGFREVLKEELGAREAAYQILDVKPGAGPDELKAAYRRAAMAHHPDRNPRERKAAKKFLLVKCAYELLAKGKHCETLLQEIGSWSGIPQATRDRLEKPWGYFTWWRENYF